MAVVVIASPGGPQPINDVTTNYTVDASDCGEVLDCVGTLTLTIDGRRLFSGFNCAIMCGDNSSITITNAVGTTLHDPNSKGSMSDNGQMATLLMRSKSEGVLL